jgi:hypothetical protein
VRHKPPDLSRLTPKQVTFLEAILQGRDICEAYRRSYRCEGSSARTIYAAAWKLARRHHVITPLIEAEQQRRIMRAAERGRQLQDRIEDKLVELIEDPNPHIALRAAKLLGELSHVQAFNKSRIEEQTFDSTAALEFLAKIDDELASRSADQVLERAFNGSSSRGAIACCEAVEAGE